MTEQGKRPPKMASEIFRRRKPGDVRWDLAVAGDIVFSKCEMRGCNRSSYGVFIKCKDGVVRELCSPCRSIAEQMGAI